MAIQLKHSKTVAKADGVDNTVVQPSDWNAAHTLTAAAGKVLGTVVGSTTVSELPISVDGSGNVGLGVTPTVKLDMAGEILIRGAAAAGSVMRITPDATGSNGVIVDTSFITGSLGPLILKMGSVERMRVTAVGEVGLGTSSPASGKGITLNSPNNYFGLEFQTSGTPIARIMQESTGFLYIDSNINGGTGGTVFRTGAIERMRIDAAGAVTIGGSPVVATSGTAAQGDVLYHNGTAWVRLAAGTSGQFLKTNGSGANPAWATPGGGVTLLGTMTAAGAPTIPLSVSLGSYKFLKLVFDGVSHSNVNAIQIALNGTAFSGGVTRTTISYGILEIDLSNGVFTAGVDGAGTVTYRLGKSTVTTSTTTLTLSLTAAGNFDAGNVKVYGIS